MCPFPTNKVILNKSKIGQERSRRKRKERDKKGKEANEKKGSLTKKKHMN